MKKLMIGIVVGLMATTAFAAPAFDINGGAQIVLTPGVPLTVAINESGSAGIQGMSLNLELLSNGGMIQIVGLDIDGAGNIFNGNTTGATINGQWAPLPDSTPVPSFLALGAVTTASGSLATTGPGRAATVTLLALPGSEHMVDVITTNSPILGPSELFTTAGAPLGASQGSTQIMVIPEPVTGLLLLAGLPLLRRRRA